MTQFKDQLHIQPPSITTRLWQEMAQLALVAIAYRVTVRFGLLFAAIARVHCANLPLNTSRQQ